MIARIQSKLFIAFLATLLGVLVVTALVMQWNFSKGFLGYVNELQARQMEAVQERFEDAYVQYGNWGVLQRDPRLWRTLVTGREHGPMRHPQRLGESGERNDRGQRVDREMYRKSRRLPVVALLDAERQRIIQFKKSNPAGREQDLPLEVDGNVVGYLRVKTHTRLQHQMDQKFAKQQIRTFWFAAIAAILFSAVASWLIARHLLSPVRKMAIATKRLQDGIYDQRVEVEGKDELASLGKSFNQMAESLQKNEKNRQQWLADIAHELRTPVTLLRGELHAVEDGIRPLNAATQKSLAREVDRLGELIEDLYELSLAEAGALRFEYSEWNLLELLQECLHKWNPAFIKQGIEIDSSGLPQHEVIVTADRQRYLQVFNNILENSLRYTDSPGQLRIFLATETGGVRIRFADSGPGVSADALPFLFERLYRTEQSRNRNHGGAGLGLAICKGIVEAQGGSISASAAEAGGLEILLRLPLRASGAAEQ